MQEASTSTVEMLAKVVAIEMLGFETRLGVRLAEVEPWPDAGVEERFAADVLELVRDYRVLLDATTALGVIERLALLLDEKSRVLASLDGERPGISSPARLASLFAAVASDLGGDSSF